MYIGLFVLILAILLYVPNLLASIAKPTIALHKTSLVSDKGRLAILGGYHTPKYDFGM
jgi:hypothetical protein